MNDNDIREIMNNCTDRIEETGVGANEVKELVMAKIGGEYKNNSYADGADDVYAEQVIVSKAKRGNIGFKYIFTAAATAACIGIAAVGIGYLRGGNDLEITSGSGEDVTLIADDPVGASADGQSENVLVVRLLDGTKVTYDFDAHSTSTTQGRGENILELRDGELWFIGNGENINVADAAGDNSYFIYTYLNYDTERAHTVAVSNTDDPEECGYFELYLMEEYEGEGFRQWETEGRNCYSVSPGTAMSAVVEAYKDWVYDALEELGLTAYDSRFRDRIADGEVIDIDMNSVVYITGSSTPVFDESDGFEKIFAEAAEAKEDLPENYTFVKEFRLLDNSNVIVAFENGYEDRHIVTITDAKPYVDIFSNENGRMYFIGNGEHEDITDIIEAGETYVYSYVHPERDMVHYIVAAAMSDGEFGYAEVIPEECNIGPTCHGYILKRTENDPEVLCSTPSWLAEFLEEKMEEIVGETDEDDSDIYSLPENYTFVKEFRLLDNSHVIIALENGKEDRRVVSMGGGKKYVDIFSNENGRLYFIGNGEHEDITDIIEAGETYVYSYVHPERDMVHYVVAAMSDGEFGYAEVFPEEDNNELMFHGENLLTLEEVEGEDAEVLYSTFSWLTEFLEEKKEETGATNYSGGGSERDFSYLFGSN